ncbi:MAG: class I SAM-dependent methyltransferase [Desulfurococcaceae archaeon]
MEDFYDILADDYDELYGEEQWVKYRFMDIHMDLILPAMILDNGCGTGVLYEYLSSSHRKPMQYICLDPSTGMLKKAREKLGNPFTLFINAYAENLPFRDKVFDYVFSITVWNNILDKAESLREMKRVVKQEGLIIISSRIVEPVMPPDIDSEFTYMGTCIDYFYVNRKIAVNPGTMCVYDHRARRYMVVSRDMARD